MSAKVMGQVWDLQLPHNKLIVLLAMADHADHDGNNVFPSIGLIAWKTGYSTRTVQRVITLLVKDGILIEVEAKPGHVKKYSIDLSKGVQKEPYKSDDTPDKMSQVQDDTPDIIVSPHPRHIHVIPPPDIAVSPKPSVEPLKEPSTDDTQPIPLNQDTNLTADKNEQVTQMQELVKSELKQYDAKRSRKIACALFGYLIGDNAQYNLDKPITHSQFKAFVEWWDKTKVKSDGEILTRPKNLGSVKSSVMEWQETATEKPKQVTKFTLTEPLKHPSLTSDYLPPKQKEGA